MPYAELNALYHHVLSTVDDVEAVKQVLGVFLVVNSMGSSSIINSVDSMDTFLGWQCGETKACLSQLASIIACDAKGGISIFHATLLEFLFDPSRSIHFYLCRESVLGDGAALGLRYMRHQRLHRIGVSFLTSDIY